jgi:hypothetical protein
LYARLELFHAVGAYIITITNPVALKNPAKNLRNKIVQFFAVLEVHEFRTVCAGHITSLNDALFDGTVSEHRLIAVATHAFLFFVSPALRTYQAAAGNQEFAGTISHFYCSYTQSLTKKNTQTCTARPF